MAYAHLKSKRLAKGQIPSRAKLKPASIIGRRISIQQARLLAFGIQAEAEKGRLQAAEEEARRAVSLEDMG